MEVMPRTYFSINIRIFDFGSHDSSDIMISLSIPGIVFTHNCVIAFLLRSSLHSLKFLLAYRVHFDVSNDSVTLSVRFDVSSLPVFPGIE